ncbi:MAG TPA: hypothetical protein VM577_15410 [Anaerovoracaceae bacterium]|nr:hypothetical protein [Anaerovoracaceae bacterium]
MAVTKNIKKLAPNKYCSEMFNRILKKPEHENMNHHIGNFIFRFFTATMLAVENGATICEVQRIHVELLRIDLESSNRWMILEEGFRADFHNFLERLSLYADYKNEFRNSFNGYCLMLEMSDLLPEKSNKQAGRMKI